MQTVNVKQVQFIVSQLYCNKAAFKESTCLQKKQTREDISQSKDTKVIYQLNATCEVWMDLDLGVGGESLMTF